MSNVRYTPERNGGRSFPWLPHLSGRYYSTPIIVGTLSANIAQPGIDLLHAWPFIVPDTTTYTEIGARITLSAGAGREMRLGIYNDDGAGYPSTLLVDSGVLSLATTGDKTAAISQQLTRGWYWLAFVCNHASPAFFGWANSDTTSWMGVTTTSGVTTPPTALRVAFTYAALPTPFTAGAVPITGNTGALRVWLKV